MVVVIIPTDNGVVAAVVTLESIVVERIEETVIEFSGSTSVITREFHHNYISERAHNYILDAKMMLTMVRTLKEKFVALKSLLLRN